MKQSGIIAVFLSVGLLLATSGWGLTADTQGNPYQSIVERNVFGLKPPPSPEENKPQAPPPPPIELQGITSMFGRQQVLFSATVPGSKPGEPAKKVGMVLKVGERQDDVEVLEINEAAGSVKFNNHGTEELKFLDKDSMKPAAAPVIASAPGVIPNRPGVPPPDKPMHSGLAAMNAGGNPVTTFGGSAGSTLRNIPSRTLRAPTAAPVGAVAPQAAPPSHDEQLLLMKVMEEKYKMEQQGILPSGGGQKVNPGQNYSPPPPPPLPVPQ